MSGRDALIKEIESRLKEVGPPQGDERYPQGYRQAMWDVLCILDDTDNSAAYYLLNTKQKYDWSY